MINGALNVLYSLDSRTLRCVLLFTVLSSFNLHAAVVSSSIDMESWEVAKTPAKDPLSLGVDDFLPFHGSIAATEKPFNSENRVFWLQSRIVNRGTDDIELGFSVGTHSSVHVYLCSEQCILSAKMGELVKPHLTSIKDSEDFSRFIIPGNFSGYLRVRISSYPQHGYRRIDPTVYTIAELQEAIISKTNLESKLLILYGFIIGALICFLVYPVNLFLHHRRRYYVYYILYVIGILITLVIRTEIELDMDQTVSQHPVFFWKLGDPSSLFGMVFYVLFFRSFIKTRLYFKRLDVALNILFYSLLAWCAVALCLNYGFDAMHWVYVSSFIMRLALVLVAIACIYSLLRQRNRIYHYVAMGTLLMTLGGVFTNILRLFPGVLHEPYLSVADWKPVYWNIGIILELIFFSLAMSYQFAKDAQEKRLALKQFVEQLTENQRLEKKYKTELELEVKERTEENLRISRELIEKEQQEFRSDFDRRLAEAELKALRSQMNPHFIFNSLNSIKLLIQKGEDEQAMNYLIQFSKLMRIALNNVSSKQVSLEEELDFCKRYLDIESLRFSDNFMCAFVIDPRIDTSYIRIPPLVIQPYIENALWHGLLHKDGNRELRIIGDFVDHESCIIRVEDNGIGREASAELNKSRTYKRKSLGQQLVQERIHLNKELNNKEIQIQIEDLMEYGKPVGTRVNIYIHPVT